MNMIIVSSIAIVLFFCSFSFYDFLGFNQSELPPVDIAVDRVLDHTLSNLQKNEPIIMIGLGGSKNNLKKETIRISLMLNKVLTKKECRKLIIKCAESYLNDINSDNELKQYLYQYPFAYKNLEISIFLKKPDGSDINYPDIRVISLYNDKISYDIQDPNSKYKYITSQEPYEEALRIVQTEK